MSDMKAKLEKYLNRQFNKLVKNTETGFKINKSDLDGQDVNSLTAANHYFGCDIQIKRSGYGLVVLITHNEL